MNIYEEIISDFLKKNQINSVSSNEVEFVNQGCFASTNNKIKGLYTQSLATCIGLIAYCDAFAFLAHIQLGSLSNNFKHEKFGDKNIVTWCNTISDLLIEININKKNIGSSINIGLVLGCMPVDENNIYRQKIEQGISILINQCEKNGIIINRMPNLFSEIVFFEQNGQKLFLNNGEIDIPKSWKPDRKLKWKV